ncbi:DNA topoisomerase-3 [Desulfitispora alkaliphila]|uniref:DNA topoisomerase III n=1 Tax=Desulfitispora alkaliphila TaxID=622674 RepID=UPI003D1C4438
MTKISKILVLTEKPATGRDIGKVLNCKQKGDGYIYGDKYVVTWAVGHLVTLMEPDEYDARYKRWSLNTLPIIPEEMKLKVPQKTSKQFKVVKKLMNSNGISSLICATDAGREGELIFRYIYNLAGCKKPFQRLWISSMTDAAIKEGFSKLKEGSEYDNLYYSAKCRSESDWLVGINGTRAFTVKYNTLFSIGRVQTPTLAMLVKRQKEIASFEPKKYWEIKANYNEFTGTWFNPETKENRTYDQEEAKAIAKKVKGKVGTVEEVKEEQKRELPPLLYDLTELQRDANKKYGLSAQQTLNIAQSLYEKYKLITYPRTDSRHLSSDMTTILKPTVAKLAVEEYKKHCDYILGLSKLPITKRIVDDTKISDHHAIIPTPVTPNLSKLSDREKNIYHLIVSRFLSVFYPNHQYTVTTIKVEVEGEKFISKGKVIKEIGWKVLQVEAETKRGKGNKEKEQILPDVSQGDQVPVESAKVVSKETKPPVPYTEATLLAAMEGAGKFVEDEELKEHLKESGLGTPATRAAIIERLIKVKYVTRNKKALVPTDKGMKIIELVPPELRSPETTGRWEKGLAAIAKGTMTPTRFMESINRYVNYIIKEAKNN